MNAAWKSGFGSHIKGMLVVLAPILDSVRYYQAVFLWKVKNTSSCRKVIPPADDLLLAKKNLVYTRWLKIRFTYD